MITSVLDAKMKVAKLACTTGMIAGSSFNITRMNGLVEYLIDGANLPNLATGQSANKLIVKEYAIDCLSNLCEASGISVTSENASILTDWILNGITK